MDNTYYGRSGSATHEVNENNRVPFCDQANKMRIFRSCLGAIHSVARVTLDKSNTLTISSGPRSNYQSFQKKVIEKFHDRKFLLEVDWTIMKIKNVGFQDLQEFFRLLDDEPRLADINQETEMAFTEFGKPPLSERLKAIKFNIDTLPEEFFDNLVTFELMDDPVYASIDKPISREDFLPGGEIRGRHTYDRKTFESLNGKCPVSGLPLKPDAYPNTGLKYRLLQIVRKAEEAAPSRL